jgi:hypothetical protein
MAKNQFSNPAFNQSGSAQTGFNIIAKTNNFTSVFDPKPLDSKEANYIEKLIVDNFRPGVIPEEQVPVDVEQLQAITAEIKAVQKQGIVLIGERIEKARGILKSYTDGTFTQWLIQTFGSKQTGYNILKYYEFYQILPTNDLKETFKKIPQKAAYVIANRNGNVEKKIEIIKAHHDSPPSDIIQLVQETFPLGSKDRRKSKDNDTLLIDSIRQNLQKLLKRKDDLASESHDALKEMRSLIDEILEKKMTPV